MSIKVFHRGIVPQTCGVGVLGVFRSPSAVGGTPTIADVGDTGGGGAGWEIASFTNEAVHGTVYKKAYEELSKKWKIVMQSPVRINTRTGHQFFFCIYDRNSKLFKTNNSKYEWPL